MIYLDYTATTPIDQEVLNTYEDVLKSYYANPNSLHDLGVGVENLMNQSRTHIAKLLQVKSEELIFTSGASEANNLAIKGYALANQHRGKHIITTSIEHSSVYFAFKQLEETFGFQVTYLPVTKEGVVMLSSLINAIREDTILVSIMCVNNELGSINPIEEIATYLKEHTRIIFHVDAVQALGKIDISLRNIDMASFAAHKIFGLKGSGLLYKQKNIILLPLISGGAQEYGFRAGTSNAPTNIVLSKTIRLAMERKEKYRNSIMELNTYLRELLLSIDDLQINSPKNASPYILHFSYPHVSSEIMLNALNNKGYCISAQTTCSSRVKEPSRVLTAIGLKEEYLYGAIRLSISHLTTKEEITSFVVDFKEVIHDYRTK